jgi:Uma2 family endonuclease
MSAILDLPEVRDRLKRWSVEEYERFTEKGVFGENVELLHGILVQKTSKSPLHGTTSKMLYDAILKQADPGFSVRQDLPLKLTDSLPEPDVAVVAGADMDFVLNHPTTAELVIEVAVSSVALDRESASMYAEAGVKEYWIVLPKQGKIEVYREPAAGGYRTTQEFQAPQVLHCVSVPSISVNLGNLFVSVAN